MKVTEPTVNIAARVPFSQWQKLVALAQKNGLFRGDRPNVSAMTCVVLERGLESMSDQESEPCKQEA